MIKQDDLKWKIRFYVNIPLNFMADVGMNLGNFNEIPMYPYQDGNKGWYFEIYDKGDSHETVLEKNIEEIHQKLDKMSLQIMREILITEIVVFNISEIFEQQNDKLLKISNNKIISIESIENQNLIQQIFRYPSGFSSQRGMWLMPPYQFSGKGTIAPRITDTKIEKTDAKALRWFIKSLGANNEVDRFTSLVTVLDILSHKNNLEETNHICQNCGKTIEYIHECGKKLQRQAYAKDYLIEFGIQQSTADRINKLRNKTLHGRKHLTSLDMDEFLDVNISVIRILVMHFKKLLKIEDFMPPVLSPGVIMVDRFCEQRSRKINQEIFDEIKSNIIP